MSAPTPKVSLIIAAYCPGDAVNRVIDSLDGQTMPQDEFEVIFVDDGSPDDTLARLNHIASTRPNYQVHTIENSGWPSKPRNVGIEHATGEYLVFMDHDDSLYLDGLERTYNYARQNNADVLSPKESKTNDVWWGMSSFTDGNIANALEEQRISRMIPMVPHKLYRRQKFIDHNIRFPEGARVLWEDWFINLDAYRHADIVSVQSDAPFYLWHASDTNTSHSFSPTRVDFWDRLDDMMSYIVDILDGPEYHRDQTLMLAHQVKIRVIDRCVTLMARPTVDRKVKAMAFGRSQELLRRFTSPEVYAELPPKHKVLYHLIDSGQVEQVLAFHDADRGVTGDVTTTATRWEDGVLHYDAIASWHPKEDTKVPSFYLKDGRAFHNLDKKVVAHIPPELLDLSALADDLIVQVAARSRAECVTWQTPYKAGPATFETGKDGTVVLVQRGSGTIDINAAAQGQPLEDTVWDIRSLTEFFGMQRKGPLLSGGGTLPGLLSGRGAVAYTNASKGLTIDLAQRLRTFAIDAEPSNGPAGSISAFSAKLAKVTVFGQTKLAADMLYAIPDGAVPETLEGDERLAALEALAADGALNASVVGEGGAARLEGSASLPAGKYVIYARREGKLNQTKRGLTVDSSGRVEFTRPTQAPRVASTAAAKVRRWRTPWR